MIEDMKVVNYRKKNEEGEIYYTHEFFVKIKGIWSRLRIEEEDQTGEKQ